MAVVGQYCRVRGVDGPRVVDASVMPNIPRANTNLTCIVIGEKVADHDAGGVTGASARAAPQGAPLARILANGHSAHLMRRGLHPPAPTHPPRDDRGVGTGRPPAGALLAQPARALDDAPARAPHDPLAFDPAHPRQVWPRRPLRVTATGRGDQVGIGPDPPPPPGGAAMAARPLTRRHRLPSPHHMMKWP